MLEVKNVLKNMNREDDWRKINDFIQKGEISKDKLIEEIINSENPIHILYAGLYIENAPVRELSEALVLTKDLDCILRFAMSVKGTSVKKLADVIIASKSAAMAYYFARDVKRKGVPVKRLCAVVAKSLEPDIIFYFARDIVFKRNYDDCNSNVILSDFERAMLNKLSQAIFKTKNTTYITLFSKFIPAQASNSLSVILENVRTGKGSVSSLILFAMANPEEQTEEIARTIAKHGGIIEMLQFAIYVPDAPLDPIINYLCKKGSVLDKISFIEKVPNAPLELMFENLLESFESYAQMCHYLSYMATGDAPGKDLAMNLLNDLNIDPYSYVQNQADQNYRSTILSKTKNIQPKSTTTTKNEQRKLYRKRQVLLNILKRIKLQRQIENASNINAINESVSSTIITEKVNPEARAK